MSNVRSGDKLAVKNGRYVCPVCGSTTQQTADLDTQAENLRLWCRKCKTKFITNIVDGQCSVVSRCP